MEPIRAVEETASAVADAVKPRLRGWLHLGMFPLALAAGFWLVTVSAPGAERIAAAVFTAAAALLFGTSAVYHLGTWPPRVAKLLKRMDHSNIFLIIAGTYTPFSVTLLPPGQARTLLWIVWVGALAGVAFRVLWVGAPRWLYTPVYVALGWVAVAYLPGFVEGGGWGVVTLIAAGGVLYTLGAVVYALRRPDPSPRWFGYHEVFHSFTLAAFVAHFVGVALSIAAA